MIREGSQLYDGLVAAFEQRDAGAVWTAKVDEFAKVSDYRTFDSFFLRVSERHVVSIF
jgi:hypothetical protein